jgi:hypothetical protein
MSPARRVLAALALVVPVLSGALEPRFDHRDQHGPIVEALASYDTVAVSGKATESSFRPSLRLAYGFDVLGEGNELVFGAQGALRTWNTPGGQKLDLVLDARYRAYFGTEELKTFFEAGLWAPVSPRVAVGPMVGLGLQYDFSRAGGMFVAGSFASAFGQARIASFTGSLGAQLRFD